jgi:hypothetical protein
LAAIRRLSYVGHRSILRDCGDRLRRWRVWLALLRDVAFE